MIKVNIDYESVLFHSQLGPKGINEYLEYLAFFIQEDVVLTSKKYSQDYLDYVARISGVTPKTQQAGAADNWWGPLKDLNQERHLNSKLNSSDLAISQGWVEAQILNSHLESYPENFFFKDPFSMSGKGFRSTADAKHIKKFPQILERKLHRIFDFSHYVLPDGQTIAYANVVDEKFQYKGSEFLDWRDATIENLGFYKEVSLARWQEFRERLQVIKSHYHVANNFGYSIDSFVYEENGELLIYPLCEVNYRRTMGRVSYELSQKYAANKKITKLVVTKAKKDFYKEFVREGVIVLSPGDARFELIFFMADTMEELTASLKACDKDLG